MFVIVGIMLTGVLTGYLFRKKNFSWIQRLITVFIWILLFLLGVDVGLNPIIINNIHTLGLEAVYITVAACLGSAVFASLLWKFANKNNKNSDS